MGRIRLPSVYFLASVFRHRVQTFTLVPAMFLVCRLMYWRRLVAMLEWLRETALFGPRPQTSQTLDIRLLS